MLKKNSTCWLAVFLLIAGPGYTQTFDIKTITPNEGFPSGQVMSVAEGREGFIWFGTLQELVRFDGKETKGFSVANGLRDNLVMSMLADRQGRFWVATYNSGVAYLQDNQFYYPEKFAPLDTLTVMHMQQAQNNDIWLTTAGQGLFIWDGNRLKNITEDDGLPSNYLVELLFRNDEETWIATEAGIAIYNPKTGEIQVVDSPEYLSGLVISGFAETQDGTIWVATNNGVTTFNGENWSQITSANGKPLGELMDILADDDGLIWIGTYQNGIYWFDGNEFTHINRKNGLSSNYTYVLYKDLRGQVWVTTNQYGVNIFKNKGIRIYENDREIGGIFDFLKHEDALWMGTDFGIAKFSGDDFEYFPVPEEFSLTGEVKSMAQLPNGNLVALNEFSSLLEFDGERFREFPLPDELSDYFFHQVVVIGKFLWLVDAGYLARYDLETGGHEIFTEGEAFGRSFLRFFSKDRSGQVWLTAEGVFSKIHDDGSLQTFFLPHSDHGAMVNVVTQDRSNGYWLGTNSGFSKVFFNENNNRVHLINYHLAAEFSDEVRFLQFDAEGNLWLGTIAGMHYITQEQLNGTEGGEADGIFMPLNNYGQGVEMGVGLSMMEEDGTLWFGSYSRGLIKYEPAFPMAKKEPPVPFVRQIQINGETAIAEEVNNTVFSHSQNHIDIQFGSFNYLDPDRVYYEYRLLGFEEKWEKTFGKTRAQYTNLAPGEYQFQLRTKSILSAWGEPETLLAFNINRPYWQSGWFYLFAVCMVIGVVYATIRVKMFYFEKKKLAGQVQEKTAELQSALNDRELLIKEIHHRVKNNMTVVSGLLEMQGYKVKDAKAKQALEDSKLRLQAISSIHQKLYQHDSLSGIKFREFILDLIRNVSESMNIEGKHIQVDANIDDIELPLDLAIPSGLILNEALSNCYEHAFKGRKEGTIFVSFTKTNDGFQMVVKDNGIGIPQKLINGERSSLGITIINSFAQQMDGTAHITNESGTTIRATFSAQV